MKRTLIKMFFIFLAITGATTLLLNFTHIQFGHVDYFTKHGWFFLFFLALFPRFTLLFSGLLLQSIEFGGLLWWISFFIAPRILVAFLATIHYWNTNQILVIFSWLIALGGESSEKVFISHRMRPQNKYKEYNGTTIEAEYTVKDK